MYMPRDTPSEEKKKNQMSNSLEQFTPLGAACFYIKLWHIYFFFSLVVPLLCREMVEHLDKTNSVVNHTSLSNYAFLYGIFPVAPGVALFATHFNMEIEIVCIYNFLNLIV